MMPNAHRNMKRTPSAVLNIAMRITLLICLSGLVAIFLFPEYYNPYLLIVFLSFTGTSLGTLLGQNARRKKNQLKLKKGN